MKDLLGRVIILLSIALGLYVGGWLLFIQPIIACAVAFDAGVLTGVMIAITVLKCVFASCVGSLIAWVGCVFGTIVLNI